MYEGLVRMLWIKCSSVERYVPLEQTSAGVSSVGTTRSSDTQGCLLRWFPLSYPLGFLSPTYDRNEIKSVKLGETETFLVRGRNPDLWSSPVKVGGIWTAENRVYQQKTRPGRGGGVRRASESLGSWEQGLLGGSCCVQRSRVLGRKDFKFFCGT